MLLFDELGAFCQLAWSGFWCITQGHARAWGNLAELFAASPPPPPPTRPPMEYHNPQAACKSVHVRHKRSAVASTLLTAIWLHVTSPACQGPAKSFIGPSVFLPAEVSIPQVDTLLVQHFEGD